MLSSFWACRPMTHSSTYYSSNSICFILQTWSYTTQIINYGFKVSANYKEWLCRAPTIHTTFGKKKAWGAFYGFLVYHFHKFFYHVGGCEIGVELDLSTLHITLNNINICIDHSREFEPVSLLCTSILLWILITRLTKYKIIYCECHSEDELIKFSSAMI